MKRSATALAAILFAAGLAATGCSSNDGASASASPAAPTGSPGQSESPTSSSSASGVDKTACAAAYHIMETLPSFGTGANAKLALDQVAINSAGQTQTVIQELANQIGLGDTTTATYKSAVTNFTDYCGPAPAPVPTT